MPIRIKAILFDLDGVLVDTLHYHYLAWQKMFADLGASVSEHSVLLHEGRTSSEILPILMQEAGIAIPAEKHDVFIDMKRAYYRRIVDVQFYDGAIEVVRALKERGFKVAIVTACAQKTMRKSLSEEHRSLFDLIQTGDDVPRAKPNLDPYDLARRKLGLQPGECVVVENAPLGIESARAAGIYCIAIETTLPRKYLDGADYYISDIRELLGVPALNVEVK
jgi:beta-phosphoglucomutase